MKKMSTHPAGRAGLLLGVTLLCGVMLGGCATASQENKPVGEAPAVSQAPENDLIIPKKSAGDPSEPKESISYENAIRLIDQCAKDELYLPQPAADYEKLYFGTIDYEGDKYYSVYFYINAGSKKVFVGSNCLVACSGDFVANKHWFGDYSVVGGKASSDKTVKEEYPQAKITPNEALVMMAENEKYLGLDHDFSDYIFEVNPELSQVSGTYCYRVTPKLEFYDRIDLQQNLYVAADGSKAVYRATSSAASEFTQLIQE